ncbi:hypothetical protein [Burkholderia ubonensis]|uniref:hypothetical protein n=1 Tax=Burkholderia ubonensis TaxID=101571 RepID=UPI0012FBA915|nr:hypothetical protein [Burkholderia ubonensis]
MARQSSNDAARSHPHDNAIVDMARTTEEAFAYMKAVAKAAGLTLLTKTWVNARVYYRFRCSSGHEFERQAFVLTRGATGCAQCVQAKTRQQFLATLSERNLTCLEGDYLGGKVRNRFQCAHGHRWDTEARKILEGSGCPKCGNARVAEMNRFSDGLKQLRDAAAAHGGQCLADVYSGVAARYWLEMHALIKLHSGSAYA